MNTHARKRKNPLRATKFASGKPALEYIDIDGTRLYSEISPTRTELTS
jgi:hypothetical protein